MSLRVLFIDRDGTLIVEPEDFQVDALEKVQLVDGVIPALLELAAHGYRFVMVSNQDGLGTESFPEDDFRICQDHMMAVFASQGIHFDLPHSAVIGDRNTDLELAQKIGVPGILLGTGGDDAVSWSAIVDQLCYSDRQASVSRQTNETQISASVNLDRAAPVEIATGIGFYDHMLEQIAKHGGFSLALRCEGDLEVDDHHTVEDTAICLGDALRKALGNKLGAGRYGFVVPMDESEARVSIDLSGRGRFVFRGDFPREQVGELATEMVEHFFRSLSDSLGAAVHIEVSGENAHHMVEACFKSVGRALRQAIRRDGNEMPSTKGTLA
jgi:imidazoleglycerol-phosphate dehydratase/histidinol-phosphatase